MAKTTFTNGTIVEPEFLNSIFQTGHNHDGGTEDGSAPAIPASDVDNDSGVTGSTVKDALNLLKTAGGIGNDSSVTGTSVKDALNNLLTASNTHQSALSTISGDIVVVTGTMEVFGFASNLECSFVCLKRRYRTATNSIVESILYLPAIYDTSTTVYLGFADATIPSSIRPQYVDHVAHIMVYDNPAGLLGACRNGHVEITATGNWAIRNYDGGNFPNSGVKGFPAQLFKYIYDVE